jgi:hypothetical protein
LRSLVTFAVSAVAAGARTGAMLHFGETGFRSCAPSAIGRPLAVDRAPREQSLRSLVTFAVSAEAGGPASSQATYRDSSFANAPSNRSTRRRIASDEA